ncbi:hypothetical protein IW146_002324 [Coemansia sp. RSA 922]|nr:hypothetical protein H4S03_000109 [Coemansia sp. S3946]KAJ2047990.1 hypothetical protein H4S04_004109 [Coemansia sp. S16]KAJ2068224.1 hypothetical protein GGI08_000988 [Coemansia sp. S2]KAJ2115436.1 hypothetical protein IW146_002324 [Coemansia sp. RSA 922]
MYASNFNRRGRGSFGSSSASRGRTPRSYVWSWKPVRGSDRYCYPAIADSVNQQAQHIERNRNNVLRTMANLLSTMSVTELGAFGYAMPGLRITRQWINDDGSSEVRLEAATEDMLLPPTIMRTGEIVRIDDTANDRVVCPFDLDAVGPIMGTIASIDPLELVINLGSGQKLPAHWGNRCSVSKLIFDVHFKRMLIALRDLASYRRTRPSLHQVVYLGATPRFYGRALLDSDFVDGSLNRSQKDAVQLAMTANAIALIHAPAGTGKTRVLIEIIRQLLRRKQRILVCGPSNVSVDNITKRLASISDISIVRTGHPDRISPATMSFSLDSLKASLTCDKDSHSPADQSVAEPTRKLSGTGLGVSSSGSPSRAASAGVIPNSEIIRTKQVVLSTLSNVGGRDLCRGCDNFDVVIIDEATQALEGEGWIAALKAPKLILAGDGNQLYPMLKNADGSAVIAGGGLGSQPPQTTLFERVLGKHGNNVTRTLQIQYRMHADIMQVSANELYKGNIVADGSVAGHVLCNLEHVEENEYTRAPLVLLDTVGCGIAESFDSFGVLGGSGCMNDGSEGRVNTGEAQLAMAYAEKLLAAGIDVKDIAVISFYDAQVALLKALGEERYPELEIGSVDAFQGREKEAVVLSMVRSNPGKEVGFLKDVRYMNVALTRARRHLCIIADSSTVSEGDPFLTALFVHLKAKALILQPSA